MSNLTWAGILGNIISILCFSTLAITLGWGLAVVIVLINIAVIGAIIEKETTK